MFFFFAFTFLSYSSYSQRVIRGIVTDKNNEALIGASVIISGCGAGTVTDIDGKFSVKINNSCTMITVTYTGYKSQSISIDSRNYYEIQLSGSGYHLGKSRIYINLESGFTNNSGGRQKQVGPKMIAAATPAGMDTMFLTPKVNPAFLRKGNTGGQCFRNNVATTGATFQATLGVRLPYRLRLESGLEYSSWSVRNFYYTDNEFFPHFMEENKIGSIGVPIKLGYAFQLTPTTSNIDIDKVKGIIYFKYAHYWNIDYTNTQYLGGTKSKFSLPVREASIIHDTNQSFGLGLTLLNFFAEYNYFPDFFLNTSGNSPFSNLVRSKSVWRFGLNYNKYTHIRLKDYVQNNYGKWYDFALSLRLPVVLPERFFTTDQPETSNINSPQGIVNALTLKGNPEEPYSICNINLGNWRLQYSTGKGKWSTDLGIDHSYFKRQSNYLYYSAQNTFIRSASNTSVSSLGLFGMVKYLNIGLGLKGDFIYRTKTIDYWADERLSKYVDFIPTGSKLFTYSVLFSFSNIEIQFFPNHFVNKEYVNRIGLTPLANSANSSVSINLKVPVLYSVTNEYGDKVPKLFDINNFFSSLLIKKQIEDQLNSF